VEEALRNAENPLAFESTADDLIEFNETARGVWLNRAEQDNWRGDSDLPLDQYPLNRDSNPEVIRKRPLDKVKYTQQIAIRYLNPPKLPTPGPLVIREEPGRQLPAAPPLVIRSLPASRPQTPAPLVIREQPPRLPTTLGTKIVHVEGKVLPPPARKVVLEKLPAQPAKPRSILIEKWLPYKRQPRRVIYEKLGVDQLVPNPHNVVIEWETPEVEITHEVTEFGVANADPEEYVRRYGPELKRAVDIPAIVAQNSGPADLFVPSGRGSQSQPAATSLELEGSEEALAALKTINLEEIGLGEYQGMFD
jgi:hypothetical protein